MARLIGRRPAALVAPAVLLLATMGTVAAASMATVRVTGWLSSISHHSASRPQPEHQRALHSSQPASATTDLPANGPGAPSIQLAARDATPDSRLPIMAFGFQSRESLMVTVEDMQGQTYWQTTLQTDESGTLRETVLALPARLGAGAYRVMVVGTASHRSASATFEVHDIPPTVTLDAYTATPGQVVGFSGTDFFPGEVVTVRLGTASGPLLSAKATAGGALSGRLQIPKLPPGAYPLTLLGASSQTPASVGFSVQGFSPWVTLDRYSPAPGEGVGFIAHGFAPGEQVFVYVNAAPGATGSPALRLTAGPSGQLVVQDTWSTSGAIPGKNVLSLVGQWSRATATAEFVVQATGKQGNRP